MGVHELPPLTADRVHHVGVSVADLDVALGFWEPFLGVEARWRTILERPYLGVHVGYPGVRIAAAFLDLPGGTVLELLDYQVDGKAELPEPTANPGSTHLCLEVSDARSAWERAVGCGARPIVPDGPVTVDGGPNEGARAAYLRIHDGVTLELFQPPPR
jgi:catechol 2,3-dioxygenase-like lactoylglutathione lyase family enzyme